MKGDEMKPILICTNNYDSFEDNGFNRDFKKIGKLVDSMKIHGFHPGSPIDCRPTKEGMYEIFQGHHRFFAAKTLGIEFWAVINQSELNPWDLEIPSTPWSSTDYVTAHSRNGNLPVLAVSEFAKANNITMTLAAMLLDGFNNNSSAITSKLKQGTFKINNFEFATRVAWALNEIDLTGCGIAKRSSFVRALCKCMTVEGFDLFKFVKKCKKHASLLKPCANSNMYVDLIESIYNRSVSIGQRIALGIEVGGR